MRLASLSYEVHRQMDVLSMAKIWARIGLSPLIVVSACTRPVTEAECDKAYDVLMELRTAGEPKLVKMVKVSELNAERPQFLAACVGKVDRRVLDCWYAAQTKEQLKACDQR